MAKFYFKGLMCPVFTPITDKKCVDYDVIEKYAQFLKMNGCNGVLINGTTGEGSCLRVDERKKLAEVWLKCCRKFELTCMIQIGGCGIKDVYDLAEHAEKIGVDCVLCLPDLFFKPNTENDLVCYIKDIMKYCPTRPFYYYHIPRMSGVNLDMCRFYDLIEQTCPTFCGIKYTNGDLEIGIKLLKNGRNIMLGADTILWGALSLGFDAAILTSLNICPEMVCDIYNCYLNKRMIEGRECQYKLNKRINEITSKGTGEWVETMKMEFNNCNKFLKVGPVCKPTITCKK